MSLEILQNHQSRARLIQAWKSEPKPLQWNTTWSYNREGMPPDHGAPTRWMEWISGVQTRIIEVARTKLHQITLDELEVQCHAVASRWLKTGDRCFHEFF